MEIVELQAKIADLETEKALLQEENDRLKQLMDEAVAAEKEKTAQLDAENESLKAEVARLLSTPDAKETDNGVGKTFELEGKKYQVLSAAISIPGFGKLSALDIIANAEAQQWLVSKGSGSIREVK